LRSQHVCAGGGAGQRQLDRLDNPAAGAVPAADAAGHRAVVSQHQKNPAPRMSIRAYPATWPYHDARSGPGSAGANRQPRRPGTDYQKRPALPLGRRYGAALQCFAGLALPGRVRHGQMDAVWLYVPFRRALFLADRARYVAAAAVAAATGAAGAGP
nr:hypothetical protein [Tanacetum cinerariifolium]